MMRDSSPLTGHPTFRRPGPRREVHHRHVLARYLASPGNDVPINHRPDGRTTKRKQKQEGNEKNTNHNIANKPIFMP